LRTADHQEALARSESRQGRRNTLQHGKRLSCHDDSGMIRAGLSECKMALASGTRLGPYEILSAVGAGGMGEVYRARDTRLDRIVAIKTLHPDLSSNPKFRQRFEREARVISSLNHPHVCTLHDIGHDQGIDYLVMEFLEGETLADRIGKGALPLNQLLKTAMEVGDALDKAHRHGIVHRDLKPGNVMLTQAGAKLMDFGLAKPAAAAVAAAGTAAVTVSKPLTEEGNIVGTLQYMAPEQLEGKEADARSDIFSFGAVLYEMATGRRAFEGKTRVSVIAAILEKEPEPISAIKPMTPPALERVVRKCLAKDPDARWQCAADLRDELKWITEAASQAGVPAPVTARRKIRERVWWGVGTLLLVLLAVLGIATWRVATKTELSFRASILPPDNATFYFQGEYGGPPVISPDGRRLAFVAQGVDGKTALYLRALDALTSQRLDGTEGASFPFWSWDSRSLGYFAAGRLKKIDASGGPPEVLCDAPSGRGGSWNSEGTIIFTPGAPGGIFRISSSGGAAVPVIRLDTRRGEITNRWPQFLPDGRHFLYYSLTSSDQPWGTYVGSLEGGEPKFILRGITNAIYAPPGYLLFVREGTLMAARFDARKLRMTGDAVPIAEHVQVSTSVARSLLSVSENGVLAFQGAPASSGSGGVLEWFDRNGKQLGTIGQGEHASLLWPRLSPDGRRLAVQIADPSSSIGDLWVYDLARGVRTRLTFGTGSDHNPTWSPDGAEIAYASDREGSSQVYRKAANAAGKEDRLLAETGMNDSPYSWSPDGRLLALERQGAQGNFNVWILPLSGDRKPQQFLESSFRTVQPQFSPNGKWLAYTSTESGGIEVYIVPYPAGSGKWPVSTAGGAYPRWRRDGKELYYLSPDDKMMAVQIAESAGKLEIGAARALFQVRQIARVGYPYDVTADGSRFLASVQTEQPSTESITLVVNWPAELNKK
jgi:serine/threonine protein kinase